MFSGFFQYSSWLNEGSPQQVLLQGEDTGEGFNLLVQADPMSLLCKGTYSVLKSSIMPAPPVLWVSYSNAEGTVTVSGAYAHPEDAEANPLYSQDIIEELVANLVQAKSFIEDPNGTTSLGEYVISAVDGRLTSLVGPGWNIIPFTSNELIPAPEGVSLSFPLQDPFQDNTQGTPENTPTSSTGSFYSLQEVLAQYLGKFDYLLKRNYRLCTPETLPVLLEELSSCETPIGFDTETTGLDITYRSMQGRGDQLVGMVFSTKEGTGWYVPLRHKLVPNICEESEITPFLVNHFKSILETKNLVFFNAPFDLKVMMTHGIFMKVFCDVQALYNLTYRHITHDKRPSLKLLTSQYLHREVLELDMFSIHTGAKKKKELTFQFSDLPEDIVLPYACADADGTLGLYNLFTSKGAIEEFGADRTLSIENAFTKVIAYSEYFGLHFDRAALPAIQEGIDKSRAEHLVAVRSLAEGTLANRLGRAITLEDALSDELGRSVKEFNPNSSQQVQALLFTLLDYPIRKRTDKGAPSASKDALEPLMSIRDSDGSPKYPLAEHFVELSTLKTFNSTFLKFLRDNELPDDVIHTSIDSFLETGRMSTSSPNVQAQPGFVKKYYTARPGYYCCNFDFSSIEYRIMACIAGETSLIEFFNDPIKDYHRRQASVLFQVPYSAVTPSMRQVAKPLNFAIPYGKGDPKLGEDLFGEVSPENTAEAARLRGLYFAGQPMVKDFFEKAKSEARSQGWVDTYFSRRRYLDPLWLGDGNYQYGLAKVERAAGNHKIQGTAADLYKIGMIRLYDAILKKGWYGKVLFGAMVHDECELEIHESIEPWEFLKVFREAVMIVIPGWCPLYVGAGFGTNWKQAKSQDIPVRVQEALELTNTDEGYSYTWDGDVERFYDFCEQLREQYMASFVVQYLVNPEHHGSTVDPDIDDFAHQVMGRAHGYNEAIPPPEKGTYPNLTNFIRHFSDDSFVTNTRMKQRNVFMDEETSYNLHSADFGWESLILPAADTVKGTPSHGDADGQMTLSSSGLPEGDNMNLLEAMEKFGSFFTYNEVIAPQGGILVVDSNDEFEDALYKIQATAPVEDPNDSFYILWFTNGEFFESGLHFPHTELNNIRTLSSKHFGGQW